VVEKKEVKKFALILLGLAWVGATFAGEIPTTTIPPLDHVFLIMMENRSYDKIIGNSDLPFINRYANSASLATNYFAVGHPSLTNYLEVVGGSNFGVVSDDAPNWHGKTQRPGLVNPIAGKGTDAGTPAGVAPFNTAIPSAPFTAATLADQLAAKGRRWKSYQESLPETGEIDGINFSDGAHSNLNMAPSGKTLHLYAVKHNPFVYFAHVQENADPKNGLDNIAGFNGANGLYADLRSGNAPDFSFIVPNQCRDMHGLENGDASCRNTASLMRAGDETLERLIKTIKASRSWGEGKNAIVLLWDENDYSATPNQVAAIVDTNYGASGVTSHEPYSHFSLLKTLEAGFGLPCINHACDASVKLMTDLFGETVQRQTQ
jgi:phosphatidylinositol-3-phosphatase